LNEKQKTFMVESPVIQSTSNVTCTWLIKVSDWVASIYKLKLKVLMQTECAIIPRS